MIVVRKSGPGDDVSYALARGLRRLPGGRGEAIEGVWSVEATEEPGAHGEGKSARTPRARRPASLAARIRALSATTAPALVVAAILAAATTAIASREAIVSIAPVTAPAYASLGLKVNLRGLEISSVRATVTKSDEGQELVVLGDIVNLRLSATPVSNLRLTLRAEDGRELYVWTAPAPKMSLGPHERAGFRARLAAPPAGVYDVLVKFGAPGDKASFTETHS